MKIYSCKKIIGLAIFYSALGQLLFSQAPCSNPNQLPNLKSVSIIEGVDFRIESSAISIQKGESVTVEVALKNTTSEEKIIPFVGFSLVDFKMTDKSGNLVPTIYELLTEKQSKGALTKEEQTTWISYHWFSGQRSVELAPHEERKLSYKMDRKFEFKNEGQFCLEIFSPRSIKADVVVPSNTLGRLRIEVK
jgi:hypothetical protein